MQVKKQGLELEIEQRTGSKLGKEYVKAVYYHPELGKEYLLAVYCHLLFHICRVHHVKFQAG